MSRKSRVMVMHAMFVTTVLAFVLTFDIMINKTRLMNEMFIERDSCGSFAPSSALAYMKIALPKRYGYGPGDLTDLIDFLKGEEGSFFLVGDTSILYGITGRESLNPALWFHWGSTMPAAGTKEYRAFESRLSDGIRENRVRFVITEGDETWMGIKLGDFKRVARYVEEHGELSRRFGGFRVYELNHAMVAADEESKGISFVYQASDAH